MANLKSIKSKILSYKKTGTVTHAMEAVSAVKMRKSQERAINARPYARAALRVLGSLANTQDTARHPLALQRSSGKVGVISITSDKGLAGSLNSAVIKKIDAFIRAKGLSANDLIFFCIGRRGHEYAIRNGYSVAYHSTNARDDLDDSDMRVVTDAVIELQTNGMLREVRVAYTNFHSTFEQSAEIHKILPVSLKVIERIVLQIPPERGKYAAPPEPVRAVPSYTLEPGASEVIDVLMPKLVNVAVFHKLLESKASEHSARMVAMKSATDKARDMARGLTRTYNKVRQAAITREVSEITSGIEAMK